MWVCFRFLYNSVVVFIRCGLNWLIRLLLMVKRLLCCMVSNCG